MTPTIPQPSDPSSSQAREHGVPGSLSVEEFKTVFRGHPGGAAVITADSPHGPVALTATSVASVSVDPPLLIFSLSEDSSAAPAIVAAPTVVVHLLDAQDLPLARLAATSGADRFSDRSAWSRLVTGEPVYHGVRAWVRCSVVERMHAGASTVIAAHAIQASVNRPVGDDDPGDALVYHNRTWHRLDDRSRLA